jgi:hypothetical protein
VRLAARRAANHDGGWQLPIEGTSSPAVRSATSRLRRGRQRRKEHPRPKCPDRSGLAIRDSEKVGAGWLADTGRITTGHAS